MTTIIYTEKFHESHRFIFNQKKVKQLILHDLFNIYNTMNYKSSV